MPRPAALFTAALILCMSLLASCTPPPIRAMSRDAAIALATENLPDGGKGYAFASAALVPTNQHYVYTTPSGVTLGGDDGPECAVFPPLPPLPFWKTCRYYPLWIVSFSRPGCQMVVEINADTGRYEGGAEAVNLDSCGSIQPTVPSPPLFQLTWE